MNTPLAYYKILDLTKLKAFADEKLNVGKMMIFLYESVENTEGKGENAGNQHFLLFPQCFPKPSSLGLLKLGLCGKIKCNNKVHKPIDLTCIIMHDACGSSKSDHSEQICNTNLLKTYLHIYDINVNLYIVIFNRTDSLPDVRIF